MNRQVAPLELNILVFFLQTGHPSGIYYFSAPAARPVCSQYTHQNKKRRRCGLFLLQCLLLGYYPLGEGFSHNAYCINPSSPSQWEGVAQAPRFLQYSYSEFRNFKWQSSSTCSICPLSTILAALMPICSKSVEMVVMPFRIYFFNGVSLYDRMPISLPTSNL
jgi:hypothetical protein